MVDHLGIQHSPVKVMFLCYGPIFFIVLVELVGYFVAESVDDRMIFSVSFLLTVQ